jgi:outer membrane protein assembly factor BamB
MIKRTLALVLLIVLAFGASWQAGSAKATGPTWRILLSSPPRELVADPAVLNLYCLLRDGIVAVDSSTGAIKWLHPRHSGEEHLLAMQDGAILDISLEGLARIGRNGQDIWARQDLARRGLCADPYKMALVGDNIWLDTGKSFEVLYQDTGRTARSIAVDGTKAGGIVAHTPRTMVLRTARNRLSAFSATALTLQWSRQFEGEDVAGLGVVSGNTLCLPTWAGPDRKSPELKFVGIELSTGNVLWSYNGRHPFGFRALGNGFVITDENLTSGVSRAVYLSADGSERVPLEGVPSVSMGINNYSEILEKDGIIYYATATDMALQAASQKTGKILWTFVPKLIGDLYCGSSYLGLVPGNQKILWIVSSEAMLIDPRTGREDMPRIVFSSGGITQAPCLFAHDRFFFLSDNNLFCYSIRKDSN